jgi:hypothetical protein
VYIHEYHTGGVNNAVRGERRGEEGIVGGLTVAVSYL